MFWVGIAIAVVAFAAEFEPIRTLSRRVLPGVRDRHFHAASAICFVLGVAVAIAAHRADVAEGARLRGELTKVRKAVAPRKLTGSQRQILLGAWRPFAGSTAKVQRRGELEAYAFGNELATVLRDAGLKVKVEGRLNSLSPPEYGIIWWVADRTDPLAEATARAFYEVGLPNRAFFVDGGADLAVRVGLKLPATE